MLSIFYAAGDAIVFFLSLSLFVHVFLFVSPEQIQSVDVTHNE